MGIARSTYYDHPGAAVDDTAIVEAMFAILDEFEFYGDLVVGAALRQQGMVVNSKKIRRLMRDTICSRESGGAWSPPPTAHDGPIFPNLATDTVPTGPNQLWVSDITYV